MTSKITEKIILTAGPHITNAEGVYALDAAINGWNHQWNRYIREFETEFSKFIGVSYALATSSCTGALHLGLLAMGIGPGDEVIIPETTWIATASAVAYVGATPVFADIDPETWVMDTSKIESLINEKTKVIIPVHLYGNPVDMDPLFYLKEKYGFFILEDAAPSIGAEYKGKKTGSLGDMAAFSFQGAKAFVTGEGGILVSNNNELMERAYFYWDHGRDPANPLSAKEIGYKYKMSNVQAALGLAQIEKAEEIVKKKRQIFKWYQERLSDINELTLNVERSWAKSIYWMTSVILKPELYINRKLFMKELKNRNIDSRPIFSPLSSFPMFVSQEERNKVAYDIPMRGINLPSGHNLEEEEVDYICYHIRDILKKNSGKTNASPWGWIGFRDNVLRRIREIKTGSDETVISFGDHHRLVALTERMINRESIITMLSEWRDKSQNMFPSQFKVTYDGTARWVSNLINEAEDRLLFLLEDQDHQYYGHIGLFRFHYKDRFCELDNIIRGIDGVSPGYMEKALKELMRWGIDELGIENYYLRVFSDNEKAIRLYHRLGFQEIQRQPLVKSEKNGVIQWIPKLDDVYSVIDRYFVTMRLYK